MIVRFVCTIMLHLKVRERLMQGLRMMKFAANMHWMFDAFYAPWLMGFLQFWTVVGVEVANIAIILTTTSEFDVVTSFLSLAVVDEFG